MTTATRSRYGFFALAALAVLMSSIDMTIVAVAIPQLGAALNAPLTWVGWLLIVYQLVQVVMMPVAGKLSDTIGRKRVFMFSVGTFTLGSLLCMVAPSIGFLILFRAIQAIGGGGVLPSAVGMVSDQFRDRRAQAISLLTSTVPIGGIIGPNVGGYILEHWSWRELFVVNVPLGVLILAGAYLLASDTAKARARRLRLDVVGLALFAGAMLTLLFGMTELGGTAALLGNRWLWGLFGLSAVLAVLFIWHIRHTPNAIVEFDLLARSPFWATNLYNFLFGAAAFGFSSFVPYYAVVKYGMTTLASGQIVTPRAIVLTAVAAVSSLFILRLGYRKPMIVGMLLMASSMVLLSLGWDALQIGGWALDGFWLMAIIMAISGAGMGLAAPASNNAALDLAPKKAAEITGLRGMFRQTGGVIGVATVVLWLSLWPNKAQALDTAFFVLAVVMLLAVPLVFVIPDRARGHGRRVSEDAEQPTTPAPVLAETSGEAR